jgi:leucyl-tRNA synthetase
MDDADWKAKNAEDLSAKVDSLFPFIEKALAASKERKPELTDRWLLSVVHGRIDVATKSLEEMKIRKALSVALLDVWNDIRWYLRRAETPRHDTLKMVFETWIRLVSPFIPFTAEELNAKMGNKGLITTADWPSPVDFPLDEAAEVSELLVAKVIEDARNLLKIIKEKKTRLTMYAASDTASGYFLELANTEKGGTGKRGEVIRKYASSGIKPERMIKLQYELGQELVARLTSLKKFDESAVLSDGATFLSNEIGIKVRVFKAGEKKVEDPANKAKDALPFKPSFYLE